MSKTSEMKEILEFARKIFDAVGIIKEESQNYIVLGLASKPDRNLDIFTTDGEKWFLPGFEKHFAPKIKVLIQEIKNAGYQAVQERYHDKASFKKLAIKAGMGRWGKNSLVINPEFGPWLRFILLKTNIPFNPVKFKQAERIEYPDCSNCGKCLDACPMKGILGPYKMIDKKRCIAYFQLENPSGSTQRCDKCLRACPVGATSEK